MQKRFTKRILKKEKTCFKNKVTKLLKQYRKIGAIFHVTALNVVMKATRFLRNMGELEVRVEKALSEKTIQDSNCITITVNQSLINVS